jgi:hypothetical protein
MIQNLEQLKSELTELASVINLFKSEAVQLRVVELILTGAIKEGGAADGPHLPATTPSRKSSGKNAKLRVKMPSGTDKTQRGSRSAAGPATLLGELINEKYFSKKHTLNDILQYCSSQKARKLKPNELSSPLARFVRNKKLTREKNADGQYEYVKP